MRTIMLLVGLPASGKSTFACDLLANQKEGEQWKRLNRDELRNSIDNGEYSPENESMITAVELTLAKKFLHSGFNVVVDDTNLNGSTRRKFHKLAQSMGDTRVVHKPFDVPVEECKRRNALRTGSARVPDEVYDRMGKYLANKKLFLAEDTYYPPIGAKGAAAIEQDESNPKAIICDLDGTAAIIHAGRNPYDASTADLDEPNTPVIECVLAMHRMGYKIIFMSGRDSKYRDASLTFIKKHFTETVPDVDEFGHVIGDKQECIPFKLFMRVSGDARQDSIVKRELFETHVLPEYHVTFALDDRNQVVDAWRGMGLACFQVNYGDF